jgi:hypothetical protein
MVRTIPDHGSRSVFDIFDVVGPLFPGPGRRHVHRPSRGRCPGDALGTPHEFSRRCTPKITYTGVINTEHTIAVRWQWATTEIAPGAVSDDTQMTLALLESLIEHKMEYDPDRASLAYMGFANANTSGIGRNTRRLFKGVKTIRGYRARATKLRDELVKCQSNGTLMRASPLALLEDFTLDHVLSNPNDVNGDANRAYLTVLRALLRGASKKDARDSLMNLEELNEDVSQAIRDSLSPTHRSGTSRARRKGG